jgi:hypothetical protein
MNWERKPIFILGGSGGLETSAAFTGAGFTAGEVGFFVQSTLANTGAAFTIATENPFFVAQKSSANDRFSIKTFPIDAKTITRIVKKTYSAPVAEVWTIGFDGVTTTKSLSYDCDSDYGFKLIAYSPYIRKFYNNIGLTQSTVIHTACCDDCEGCSSADCFFETAKFVKAFNETNQASIPARFVFAEMLLDGAASDITTGLTDSTTASFTYGSKIVTFSGNQTIATGAYIRVSPSNVSAPTNADPVFKVAVGVTAGTQITLDTPWNRASDAGIVIDTTLSDTELAIVVTSAVTACGIQFTGKFLDAYSGCCCFPPFPFDYEGVTFRITRDTAGSFPCTFDSSQLVAFSPGRGTSREMLYLEMDAKGYTDQRQWFLDCAANLGYFSSVVSTDTYDLYTIESSNTYPTTSMGGQRATTPAITYIAATNTTPGTPGSTTATNLDTILASIAAAANISVTT